MQKKLGHAQEYAFFGKTYFLGEIGNPYLRCPTEHFIISEPQKPLSAVFLGLI